MNFKDVFVIKSKLAGPTLAIFAGVHGNELAGVFALRELIPKLTITKGKLYLVFANQPAIETNVRMINKNLNRCFYKGNMQKDPEDIRARALMKILDECEALLDLHMFYDDKGEPFVICEDNAIRLAKIFDTKVISTNWTATEPGGSDGYMYLNGKLGICLECGPISKASQYQSFAVNAVYQFLKFFDMTKSDITYSNLTKQVIRAEKTVCKSSKDFVLEPGLKNFQLMKEDQLIACEKDKRFTAKSGDYIIFPHYNARINEEAYIIGKAVEE